MLICGETFPQFLSSQLSSFQTQYTSINQYRQIIFQTIVEKIPL
jgi:hypothetical protein